MILNPPSSSRKIESPSDASGLCVPLVRYPRRDDVGNQRVAECLDLSRPQRRSADERVRLALLALVEIFFGQFLSPIQIVFRASIVMAACDGRAGKWNQDADIDPIWPMLEYPCPRAGHAIRILTRQAQDK